MRKVFLDDLPKWKDGINEGKINWKESVGYKVKFVYDDIEDEVKIIDYLIEKYKYYVKIKYKNDILNICIANFIKCMIGTLIGKVNKKYKYNIGDIIKIRECKIQIVEQIRMKNVNNTQKGYKYTCLVDGNVDQISETDLTKGVGCNVCAGKKVLKGINDLWNIYSSIAKLLKHPERGYELSFRSNKSEIFICPECGYEKPYIISSVTSRGFSCAKCGDGISYPNKFMRSFLNQLNEKYTSEYSSDWAFIKHDNSKLSGKKKYDIYLPDRNEIWEIHGLQHYEESFKSFKKARSLAEEQENDKIKKELAEQNGLKYIVVDARYSDMEYIKNSLLNLPEIKRYDLSKVNWLKCHEFACNSLVKLACDLWNSGIRNTREIGQEVKVHGGTICRYLKQGAKLGWCDYDSNEQIKRKIVQFSLDGIYIQEWDSIADVERRLNINHTHISQCCSGKNQYAGGFRWMYIEDYLKNKDNLIFDKITGKRAIVQLTLDKKFLKAYESTKQAERETSIDNASICRCCKNKYNQAGGFKWVYKEDYEEYIKQQQNKTNSQDCIDSEQSFSFTQLQT